MAGGIIDALRKARDKRKDRTESGSIKTKTRISPKGEKIRVKKRFVRN